MWLMTSFRARIIETTMSDGIRLACESDNRTMFVLDRASGRYERLAQNHPFRHGAAGVAIEWDVGLFSRETVLLALFADRKTLVCRVGRQEFDLCDPRTHTRVDALFIRCFEIWQSDSCAVRHLYWRSAHGDLDDDLPRLIAWLSRDRVERLRTLLRYQASAAGRNVLDPGVYHELEAELAERLSSSAIGDRDAQ